MLPTSSRAYRSESLAIGTHRMPELPSIPTLPSKTQEVATERLATAAPPASPKLSKEQVKVQKELDKITAQLDLKARQTLEASRSSKISSHQASKSLTATMKEVAVKAGVIFGAIVFAIPVLIAGGAVRAATALKGRILAKADPENLEVATKKMKSAEETAKLTALQSVFKTEKGDKTTEAWLKELHAQTQQDLSKVETKQDKLARFYLRALARQGQNDTPDLRAKIKAASRQLKPEDFADEQSLLQALNSDWKSILKDDLPQFMAELRATDDTTKDAQAVQLNNTLQELVRLLESPSKDTSATNMQITQKLRAALGTLAYAALKENPDNGSVRLLHAMAAAIWNDVKALDSYKELGEAALRRVDKGADEKLTGPGMRALLEKSHTKAAQELLTDHGIPAKILYAIQHPVQTLSSMASEGGLLRSVAGIFGKDVYDSHALLSNNPSLQGVTSAKISADGQLVSAKIHNCYGGSPTVGDDLISPEFDAVCQAAENKRFSSKPDSRIPDVVYYTNFQNIENTGGEGARSQTIMAQNMRFPLSFTGITLSKDSEFYMMKGYKKDPESIVWKGADAFGDEMLRRMMQDACFSNTGRPGNPAGSGFYFPGKKEEWQPVFQKIMEHAKEHFQSAEDCTGEEAYKLRGAFQEYVYSMVQGYVEMKLAKEAARQTGSGDVTVMAVRACKENIDRGGAENTKYMYSRLPPEMPAAEKEALITGAFQSRALSARNRVILEHRLPQIFAFMEHVEPETFQKESLFLMQDLGIEFADAGRPVFKPALQEKPEIPAGG